MKKNILVSIILCVLIGFLSAQKINGPSIHFKKTEVDFKQVPPDTLLHYTFEFQNRGTDTLSILNVRPG